MMDKRAEQLTRSTLHIISAVKTLCQRVLSRIWMVYDVIVLAFHDQEEILAPLAQCVTLRCS